MRYLLLSACLLFALTISAQQNDFQKKEYIHSDGKKLPYRILFPENYDPHRKYPLVLFLHGAGERGTDNEKQLTHGSSLFLKNRSAFPAIVVFPQCPPESYWASVKIDRSTSPIRLDFDYSREPNWPLVSAMEVVRSLMKDEGVDKKRIYIVGLSMGGMGTFEAVYRHPKLFAAAVPICGGGDTQRYEKVKTSFRVFHGEADQVVGVDQSRKMVDALQKLGNDVTYKEYPGVNHNSWDNAFAEPDFLSWLFSHARRKARW